MKRHAKDKQKTLDEHSLELRNSRTTYQQDASHYSGEEIISEELFSKKL